MKKVFIEGHDRLLYRMFVQEGWQIAGTLFDDAVDLLVLEGGADVSPEIYGEKNTQSMVSPNKDYTSFGLLHIASKLMNIPVAGICRGSQVMCVYNGGSMVQHLKTHSGPNHTLVVDGREYIVSSAHHQESIPNEGSGTRVYRAEDGTTEIVVYERAKMFGFQPHPEYHDYGHECRELFFNLVDEVMR